MSDNNELLTSSVPRTLETKSKLMGFELSDVLIILLNLSIQNLAFSSTPLKIPMVVGSSIALGGLLFFFKKGKPDNYIQHYAEHLFSPVVRSANSEDSSYQSVKKDSSHEY